MQIVIYFVHVWSYWVIKRKISVIV